MHHPWRNVRIARRRLLAALRMLFALALATAIAWPSSAVSAAGSRGAVKDHNQVAVFPLEPDATSLIYVGSMTTSVEVRNIYLQPVRVITNSYPAVVIIEPPHVDDIGQTESNPFRMIVVRDPNTPTSVRDLAEISLWSSSLFTTPSDRQTRHLVQYWNYTMEGNRFSGLLTNTHRGEGLVLNQIVSQVELGPYNWMSCIGHIIGSDEGGSPSAVLNGALSETEIVIQVEGYGNYCGTSFAPFISQIVAQRLVNTPAAPSDLTVTNIAANQIRLAWTDNANNEAAFSLERSADAANWQETARLPANTVTYTDRSVAAAATYHYRIKALNGDGASAYTPSVTATTPPAAGGTGGAAQLHLPFVQRP